jgi:hypothetical protein
VSFRNSLAGIAASSTRLVRGASKGIIQLKKLADKQTQVTFIINVDLKGAIPSALINSRLQSFLDNSITMLEFQRATAKALDIELRAAFVEKIQHYSAKSSSSAGSSAPSVKV